MAGSGGSRATELSEHRPAYSRTMATWRRGCSPCIRSSGDRRWLDRAESLLDVALAHFADGAGGFFDTADDAERLVRRPRDPTDGATPAGSSALAQALVTSAALTADTERRDVAERALGGVAPIVERQPRFAGWSAAAAEALLAGPVEVAVVDSPALARDRPARHITRRRRGHRR